MIAGTVTVAAAMPDASRTRSVALSARNCSVLRSTSSRVKARPSTRRTPSVSSIRSSAA